MRILDLKNEDESIVKNILEFSRLDQVEPKHVEWLWENRLARGKLTLLAGEPGIGKSQTVIDIIARLSTGDLWPDVPERGPLRRAPLGSSIYGRIRQWTTWRGANGSERISGRD